MIHRDLKPSNVFRLADGRVKILDFGLARWAEAPKTTFGITGTPHYMSPEQVRGENVDERSDLFSLGSMFYEMLTDQRCFPAANIHAILFQVLQRQPPAMRVRAARAAGPGRPHPGQGAGQGARPALRQRPRAAKRRCTPCGASSRASSTKPPRRPRWEAMGLPPAPAGSGGAGLAAGRGRARLGAGVAVGGAADRAGDGAPAGGRERRAAFASGASSGMAPGGSAALIEPVAGEREAEVRFLREANGEVALRIKPSEGKSLLDVALGAGIPCYHECGGRARCSTCRVRVVEGTGLLPRTDRESRLAARAGWGPRSVFPARRWWWATSRCSG